MATAQMAQTPMAQTPMAQTPMAQTPMAQTPMAPRGREMRATAPRLARRAGVPRSTPWVNRTSPDHEGHEGHEALSPAG